MRFRIDDFIEATASGQASEKRRRLDELTSALQRGDRLVVSELSRLGRSLGQIVTILDALAKAGVAFVALKENIRVEGKRDIQTNVMTTLFALFAEVERDLISERTREGLARGQGPRAGSSGVRRARWAYHGSTARRTKSGVSSIWASRRPPSPSSRACPGPPCDGPPWKATAPFDVSSSRTKLQTNVLTIVAGGLRTGLY